MTFSETVLKFSRLAMTCENLGEKGIARECSEFSNELLDESIDKIEIHLVDCNTSLETDPFYIASNIRAFKGSFDNGKENINVQLSNKLWKILGSS